MLKVLGLRAMFVKFVFLVVLAIWCFSGFLLAFYLLSAGSFDISEIGKVGTKDEVFDGWLPCWLKFRSLKYMIWTTFGESRNISILNWYLEC